MPAKAISLLLGLHEAEKTPSRAMGIFFAFLVLTSIIWSASEDPDFVAMTIFSPSGDHEIPGCNHFSSSKLTERLPSMRVVFSYPW